MKTAIVMLELGIPDEATLEDARRLALEVEGIALQPRPKDGYPLVNTKPVGRCAGVEVLELEPGSDRETLDRATSSALAAMGGVLRNEDDPDRPAHWVALSIIATMRHEDDVDGQGTGALVGSRATTQTASSLPTDLPDPLINQLAVSAGIAGVVEWARGHNIDPRPHIAGVLGGDR